MLRLKPVAQHMQPFFVLRVEMWPYVLQPLMLLCYSQSSMASSVYIGSARAAWAALQLLGLWDWGTGVLLKGSPIRCCRRPLQGNQVAYMVAAQLHMCPQTAALTSIGQVGSVHVVEDHNSKEQRHQVPADAGIQLVQQLWRVIRLMARPDEYGCL